MVPLQELSHVITKLDYIINWSKERESQLGYFPALYQRTTIEVERAIDKNFFDNGEEMKVLDIRFAEYYLRAFESYMREDGQVSKSWLFPFQVAQKSDVSVLQHLFLGMNAHINLDLGIALADMATPDTIHLYKRDFYKINYILYSLVDQMQNMIAQVWGPLKYLDILLGRLDEKFIEWILRYFRNEAWKFANELVRCSTQKERTEKIAKMDYKVSKMAQKIAYPIPFRYNPIFRYIVVQENNQISKIIDILHQAHIYRKW